MTKKKILKTLYEKKDEYIPVEEFVNETGKSQKEVENEFLTLEDEGYIINYSKSGYRLIKTPNLLLPYEVKRELKTNFIGHDIHYFKEVDSTNDVAKYLAEEGAEEGTIVIAEIQNRGKGRRGKTWISPPGGVWMSIILRPDIPPFNAPQLTLVTGVAVAETLQKECNLDVGIKWPNDILIGNKKVCGILTEVNASIEKVNYVVVGIGIDMNVDVPLFPPDLQKGATSLKNELNTEINGAILVQKFLLEFETIYNEFKAGKFPEILKEWRSLSKTIGNNVEVRTRGKTIRGEAVGINKEGILILELEDGSLRKIISGECLHINNS
ncbi:biotin--[acetyl-CoA-carboxylase] ligase [Methanobacterium spitsbergense]|uniref:Biotin--[acetyl-CoA-carboxylase] ligase n=1 Tax=Methanobacterium spitsbergense TaxID=2874285 RepID=A0A8T5UR17_9EURY|nr:biotin--[acetyl-CoA-carboxylase] ligase [Methanobacterium spitsbergense]MBZ2166208.1 biotin--[acetyl-CoA-carboxylase] ligase [Methanobacterium spitsbergense]